jgi:transcriptional regulator with XRE-family HTH domain
MSLGEVIQQNRQRLGISQQELASRLAARRFNVPRTTIASWESGQARNSLDWNPDFLAALAAALETDPAGLLDQLGFGGLYSPADAEIIARLRAIPDIEERKRAAQMLNTILEEFGV